MFQDCRQQVNRLLTSVHALDSATKILKLNPLAGREWYDLLIRKLVPQLGDDSFLIVAIVGGTNIGKSVIFNHIAGFRASATSPLASGTKHPTVLLPKGFADHHNLQTLFPEFVILQSERPEQALTEDSRHLLFWREHESTPENLLILDTPDVDSVARINWERADHIRQCADVLVAVLTQQKYNDAAVKEFFRKAAQEDKLVLVVFNQVLLPEDEEYWPVWLQTFCEETGISPHTVYLAPNDRRAAESLALPFYERSQSSHTPQEKADLERTPHSLLQDLSALRFGEIKLQTLTGSLNHLVDLQAGIPGWMNEIKQRSREFAEAYKLLSAHQLAEVDRWPTVPNRILIQQIRKWWAERRVGWARSVHGFYNRVGEVVTAPAKFLWSKTSAPVEPPLETYRKLEWSAVLQAVERVFDKLTWLQSLDNPLLSPRLGEILSGNARSQFINELKADHEATNFEDELSRLVEDHLQGFETESPEHFKLFRRIDTLAAATRPALSVLLFASGAGPVGHALMPVMTDGALQSILHVASDAVGGTVVTAVGDRVISEGASTGAGYLEAKFHQLHTGFAQIRGEWLLTRLRQRILGTMADDLAAGARLTESQEYQALQSDVLTLQTLLAKHS